jgi:hypothetical protein
MFKGTITGGPGTFNFNPTFVGQGVHPDGHTITFARKSNFSITSADIREPARIPHRASPIHDGTDVWVGTDGGVFRSTTSGALGTFLPRNTGLAITQMTYLAQREDTDAVIFAGSQDNGNVRFWGEPAWYEAPEGDGGGVAIDPNCQYRVMRQNVRAELWASCDGGRWETTRGISSHRPGRELGHFILCTNCGDAARRSSHAVRFWH